MRFTKFAGNPCLKPNAANEWESLCVLNPAVWYEKKDDTFYMLYRAAGDTNEHYMYLGLAASRDGFSFTRRGDRPVLSPDIDGADGGGIEDPRVIKMGEWYYVTYASRPYAPGRYWLNEPKPWFNPPPEVKCARENATLTHLAVTKDFINFKKLGRITDARDDDRDVILFPEKVNGKFVRLSRPMEKCGKGFENKKPATWIAYSDDMLEWREPKLLFEGTQWWENYKSGAGAPPIKTKYGWFLLYHGVAEKDKKYRVGALLLDLKDPSKIIAKTKDFLMEPEFDYETKGNYNGCVFPTANAVKDGVLYTWYGAADKYICAATIDFDRLLKFMLEN